MQTKLTHHHLTTEAVNDERASEVPPRALGLTRPQCKVRCSEKQ